MQTNVKPGYSRAEQAHAKGKAKQACLQRVCAFTPQAAKHREGEKRDGEKIKRRKTENGYRTHQKGDNEFGADYIQWLFQ